MTGDAELSLQSTTRRFDTMAALRSSSSVTTFLSESFCSASSTMLNRPLDDLEPRGDDGGRLLAAEHRLGDLGRVGEVADPGLDDLDPGPLEAFGELLLEDAVHMVGAAAKGHGLFGIVLESVVR